MGNHLAQHARATLAAHYLFSGEWADLLVEHGLEARGVGYENVIDRTGPLVLRTVHFALESGRFAIDGLGEQSYVQAVHSEEDPEQVIDILAWSANRPHLYGTYLGNAGLLGGDAPLNPASFSESPCPIWATPLAWLQAGLKGAVVLSANLAAPILARAPGKFQCEDEDHARWLFESGALPIENILIPWSAAA